MFEVLGVKSVEYIVLVLLFFFLLANGCVKEVSDKQLSEATNLKNSKRTVENGIIEGTVKINEGGERSEKEIGIEKTTEKSIEESIEEAANAHGFEPVKEKEVVENTFDNYFYVKGMRGYKGENLKVVIGKGYTKSNGDYAINLKLYDKENKLIDSREFVNGDTQSKFMNKDGDRIIRSGFVVTKILKRIEKGIENYFVQIV